MKIVSSLFVLLLINFITNFSILNEANADVDIGNSAYIITHSSLPSEIKKIQTLLQKVGAYTGQVDGNYSSVKAVIIELQISFGIISNANDLKAGKVNTLFLTKVRDKYKNLFETTHGVQEQQKTPIQKNQFLKDTTVYTGNTMFVVSAYYSPLPNQKKYLNGSYSAEIAMNGNGTHGASGASVHEGFLAAPKNYPFGTKIYLEGIGVGIVEDRGGAIVNAGDRGYSYDRIDVWMGYGDAGLERAIQWGVRTVSGKVLGENAEIIMNFETSVASEYYDLKVTPDSEGEPVKRLQRLLNKLGKYHGDIDGKYSSVESALLDYQKEVGIISDKDSWGAGYFGSQTFNQVQKSLNGELKATDKQTNDSEKDQFPALTRQEKNELQEKGKIVKRELQEKAKGNQLLEDVYNRKIKKRLEDSIIKSSSVKEKEKLKFLISIL